MPELPEVQTIVDDLKKVLRGLTVSDAWTDWRKMIKHPKNFKDFKKEIIRKKILKIDRRGKNILIDLSGGKTLLIHQKMTGHLLYGSFNYFNGKWQPKEKGPIKDDPQNRFLHLVLSLSGNKQLALSDVRKFAKVLLWDTDKLKDLEDIKDLGIEPLSKDFTFRKFKEILSGKKGAVKEVLMKQNIIAGIGNIYASEILWEAEVYPFKNITELKESELKKIYTAILKILNKALKARGDSIIDYRDLYGRPGGYQKMHTAYRMEGKKCLRGDGGIIKRIKQKGRSVFFCPVHQK